ncbi:division/cell wall cluster transcriptional repressor MraZ [Candidatus Microgenomates bacterium]|nr:division/cell wall cluster transcriptional repressor MraZ [Candidatus Microgenomates bacterium]
MIIGEYKSKVGEKKRVSLPKKFREELGEDLILTRGYENALVFVNKNMWQKVAQEVMNGSFTNKDIRDTSRFLVGGAKEIDLDNQGRFIIPQTLFEHAKLKTNIVFIGLVNWVEIWDEESWQERVKYLQEHGEEIAQEISKMNPQNNG